MKDIKADSFSALTNIKADLLKVENKAENVTNIKADWNFKWGTRPTILARHFFLANQALPDLPASFRS
jgi:hypothetical protein